MFIVHVLSQILLFVGELSFCNGKVISRKPPCIHDKVMMCIQPVYTFMDCIHVCTFTMDTEEFTSQCSLTYQCLPSQLMPY